MECEQQKSAECTFLEEKRSSHAGSLKCNKLSSLPDHTSSPNIAPLQHIYKVYPERWVILIAVFLLNIANYAHWVAFPSVNKVRLKICMPIQKTTKNCQFWGFSFEFVFQVPSERLTQVSRRYSITIPESDFLKLCFFCSIFFRNFKFDKNLKKTSQWQEVQIFQNLGQHVGAFFQHPKQWIRRNMKLFGNFP